MHQEATKEIKMALQEHFKHPFYLTKKGRWVKIKWTDGPPLKEVKEFCSKYNDTMHDDPLADLWAGTQYTLEYRNYSEKYNWLLCSDVDLRKNPTLKEQMQNLFNSFRYYPYANRELYTNDGEFTLTVDAVYFDAEKRESVEKCLKNQGYDVKFELNNDTVKMTVKGGEKK